MKKHGNFRINIFLAIILLFSGLMVYRLFILSVVRHSVYSWTAQAQSENINNILARGSIYFAEKDSDGIVAATNKKFPLVHIIPSDIKENDRSEAASRLAEILGLDSGIILEKIQSGSGSLRVILRKISDEQILAVKNIGIKGIGISYETDRYYPAGSIAADIIGFLGYNAEGKRAGQYGIESYYDNELFGRDPNLNDFLSITKTKQIIRSLLGIFIKEEEKNEDENSFDRPADIFLTIDKNIQTFVEDKLRTIIEKWEAERGSVIVQDPHTGKILAMADWPAFDPNSYGDYDSKYFLNSNIQEIYEPGSSFKPITMAAGLDLAKINPTTTYEDRGFINVAGYTIHNFSNRIFGVQTMAQVLEKSINTGTMFVEELVGDDNFMNYVINMGFGQKTGIDLSGEVSGDINNLYSGRKINYLTASFGQGIAVTPLQLINAYSAIANGGKLMRPYVVSKIVKSGGEQSAAQPEVVSIPISEKTAVKLQSMLVGVVDNGFDKARVPGYDIAGKTGTAQIANSEGGYVEGEFIHNFLGFAPAYNAKFTVLIKMDRPKGITFAADSLSSTYKEIATFLLNYYSIAPTRK